MYKRSRICYGNLRPFSFPPDTVTIDPPNPSA
ncbi:unnamed protein product [Spirodela intermedia]|uniref:Uncharacterized protein n=2 Tax=Spirodela intermedia TaxID=51605 RepID=A0A7I8KGQ0_SPIIN|nr:unnamed protein product [Spirodela intermedia]CAA6660612.1 unnamed protein product [Spirodela intermedia]CAA7396969.1 unnamed protein product [Spirodela intermedia]